MTSMKVFDSGTIIHVGSTQYSVYMRSDIKYSKHVEPTLTGMTLLGLYVTQKIIGARSPLSHVPINEIAANIGHTPN